MTLSALAVSKSRPRDKQYKLTDGAGLYLLVTPTGGRYWRFNYRFCGKCQTLALGVFPDVGLAEARTRRATARRLLAAGEDPAQKKREAKLQARLGSGTMFRAIAESGSPSASAKASPRSRSTRQNGC